MTQAYRSAQPKRFVKAEPAPRGRMDARERRSLVLDVFGGEEFVTDVRLHRLADWVYAAGLAAGRTEAERDIQRAFAAGWAAAERALQGE